MVVSHQHEESLVSFYHRAAQKDWLASLLPRRKRRRGASQTQPRQTSSNNGVAITNPRRGVEGRGTPGIGKADLCLFAVGPGWVVGLHERTNRFSIVHARVHRKAVIPARDTCPHNSARFHRRYAKPSAFFDNGKRVREHQGFTNPLASNLPRRSP